MSKTLTEFCCPCGCDCDKKVVVEYLYLDLQTCERCIGTDSVLDEVMRVLTPALELAGFDVEYNKTEIKTVDMAIQHQFVSSPTIRVNGQDICESVVAAVVISATQMWNAVCLSITERLTRFHPKKC